MDTGTVAGTVDMHSLDRVNMACDRQHPCNIGPGVIGACPRVARRDRIHAARSQAGDAPRSRRTRVTTTVVAPARAAEPATTYRASKCDPYTTLLSALRKRGSLANADAQAVMDLDDAAVRPLLQRLVAEGHARVE